MKKLVLLACVVLWVGCKEDPPSLDGGVPADAASLDGGALLSCAELLSCAAECPDDACADACIAQGSSEGIAQATALVECVQREACGDDSECIQTRCASEVGICLGTAPLTDGGIPLDGGGVIIRPDAASPDAGTSTFPARIEGTTRDFTPVAGTTHTMDSNGTVVFVRDDAAGAAAGLDVEHHAFYRLQQITYRATYSGVDVCTMSADVTKTFTDPPAFDNHLMLERVPGTDGLHGYEIGIALSSVEPAAMVIVCPPPAGTSTGSFDAAHNVSTGTSHPRGDGRSFVGSTTLSARNWEWNLHAVD